MMLVMLRWITKATILALASYGTGALIADLIASYEDQRAAVLLNRQARKAVKSNKYVGREWGRSSAIQ